MPPKDWKKYKQQRTSRTLTMIVPDDAIKNRVQTLARNDKRSVNSWLLRYLYPALLNELITQEERIKAADRARASII